MEECYFQLHAEACNFTKSNTPVLVFFTFFVNRGNGTKLRNASHISLMRCDKNKLVCDG